jgi:hypothetical protein
MLISHLISDEYFGLEPWDRVKYGNK